MSTWHIVLLYRLVEVDLVEINSRLLRNSADHLDLLAVQLLNFWTDLCWWARYWTNFFACPSWVALALHVCTSIHHLLLNLDLCMQLCLLLHELRLSEIRRDWVLSVWGLACEKFVLALDLAVNLIFLGRWTLWFGKLNMERLNIMSGNLYVLRCCLSRLELLCVLW